MLACRIHRARPCSGPCSRIDKLVFSEILWRDAIWFQLIDDKNLLADPNRLRCIIELLYDNGAPRLSRVHELVLSALGAETLWGDPNVSPDPLIERVREARSASIDNGSQKRDEMRKLFERSIDDFVWLAQERR